MTPASSPHWPDRQPAAASLERSGRSTRIAIVPNCRTDAPGDFEIRGVPPGRYVIGINLRDLPSNLNPYGRTLYPSNDTDGEIVTIGAGHAFDLGTWRLPPPLPVVKVPGVAGRHSRS